MNLKMLIFFLLLNISGGCLVRGAIAEEVNVAELGIKGDGVTDNTLLLSRITKTHKNLYFPKGRYLTKSWVIYESNVSIRGDGVGLTILKSTGQVNDHLLTLINAQQVDISNLTIDGSGDKMPKPPRGDGAGCLTISRDCSDINLRLVEFKNAFNKQVTVLGSAIQFSSCTFNGDSGITQNFDGIHLYGGTKKLSGIKILNCTFNNLTRAGVYSDIFVENVEISGCEFNNSSKNYGGTIGIIIQGGGSGFSITNNKFLSLSKGINLRNGASKIFIDGNSFKYIYSNAVMLSVSGAINNKISREIQYKTMQNFALAKSGNRFNSSFDDIKITGNSLTLSKFKGRIIEPRTSAFLLLTSDRNSGVKTSFSNITVNECMITNSWIDLKSFIMINLDDNDFVDTLKLNNNKMINTKPAISYSGTSQARVKNILKN